MKTALLTGGTGFIGRNVLPLLRQKFYVYAPTREELDLRDGSGVKRYLDAHSVDVVFHCANPNPDKNPKADSQARFAEDSLRAFLNLYACGQSFGKMIYLGSGAEYNKQMEIQNVCEAECFRAVPCEPYGLAKYAMNAIAAQSKNIYNLCLFGCYGPGDQPHKFITHCIRSCLRGGAITIRQDCRFDYIQVTDLGRAMVWAGTHELQHHMYNISGCEHAFLSQIAEEVRRQMGNELPVQIMTPGLNREYTANGKRFWHESRLEGPMTLEQGIALQIKWEREHAE